MSLDCLYHAALCMESQDALISQKEDCRPDSVAHSEPSDLPLGSFVSGREGASVKEEEDQMPPPSPSSPMCEACLFCGIKLQTSDTRKRCKTPASIREFVVDYCRPTAFIYLVFANLQGDRRVPLCIACVNWQRRCSKGQRKRCNGKKPMLLMDHFVAFMLEPGKTIVPDQRCALRLVRALLARLDGEVNQSCCGDACGVNPLELMPVQVQVMVSRLPRDITGDTLLPQLVKAWWEFNGRSVFFAHNLTAKLVRKMIKVF